MHLMMRPPSPTRRREEVPQIDPNVFSAFKQAKEVKIQVQAPPPPKRQNPAQKFAQEIQNEDPAPKAKKPPPKSSKSVSSYKNSSSKSSDKSSGSYSKSGGTDASSSSSVFSGVSFNKKAQQSDSAKPKQPNNNVNKNNQANNPNNSKISNAANNANNNRPNNTNNNTKNSSNSSNGKLVIGDPLKKPSAPSTTASKPTTSTSNYQSKYNTTTNNTKSSAPKSSSGSQGSINGIKLGLNLPSKEKLKQVEDEEKELQRKLAEIQRKKQQLAGGTGSAPQQRPGAIGTNGQRVRSAPPVPAHLLTPAQRAAMASNASANNKSIFRSPYDDHPARRAPPPPPPQAHEESYEEDSFVASEEASDIEEDYYEEDWKRALRSVTGYNPAKYYDDGDDRDMEAGFDEIEHEERRSTWLGRKEDAEEERKERERMLRKAGKLPPAPSSSSGEKRKQVDGGHKNQGPPPKKPKTSNNNNDYRQNQLARAVPGQLNIGSGVKPGGINAQQVKKPQMNIKKNDDPFF